MASIRIEDPLNLHQDLTEVMAQIDKVMPEAGVERAMAYRRLSDCRATIRAAIASTNATVEIQEAA